MVQMTKINLVSSVICVRITGYSFVRYLTLKFCLQGVWPDKNFQARHPEALKDYSLI